MGGIKKKGGGGGGRKGKGESKERGWGDCDRIVGGRFDE